MNDEVSPPRTETPNRLDSDLTLQDGPRVGRSRIQSRRVRYTMVYSVRTGPEGDPVQGEDTGTTTTTRVVVTPLVVWTRPCSVHVSGTWSPDSESEGWITVSLLNEFFLLRTFLRGPHDSREGWGGTERTLPTVPLHRRRGSLPPLCRFLLVDGTPTVRRDLRQTSCSGERGPTVRDGLEDPTHVTGLDHLPTRPGQSG